MLTVKVKRVSSFGFLMQTTFDAPEGDDPIALDLGSMGKGQAWVNGHGIGRYWTLVAPKNGCRDYCDYRGAYHENKCTTNCGLPTQSWYVDMLLKNDKFKLLFKFSFLHI